MKKTYVMIVITLLFLTVLHASTVVSEKEKTISGEGKTLTTIANQDELDQEQSVYIEGIFVPVGRMQLDETLVMVQVAQSFIPTKPLLTRVELYAIKNVTASHPLSVGIRDNLTHQNLVETNVPPEAFLSDNFSWVQCDFDDIWVTPGQTFYIVAKTKNVTDNWYAWAANNHSDSYPDGCAWFSIDNGSSWNQSAATQQHSHNKINVQQPAPLGRDNASGDMCFRTYGLLEATLDLTTGGTIFTPAILVTNIGATTTWNVHWEMAVTGGLFHMINVSTDGTQSELSAGQTISLPVSLFGIGPVQITVEVQAANAQKVSLTKDAVVLFIFVFWK